MLNCEESISKNNFAKKENIMVAKKKGLYLGLLIALVGIGNAMQAYTVTIKNGTPYTIKFHADFIACKDNKEELGAGHSRRISAGGCLMRALRATVYEKPGVLIDPMAARQQERAVKAEGYSASAGVGGGTFLITGPYGIGQNTTYIVTRKVN